MNALVQFNNRHMRAIVWVMRIAIGAVFIVSGLAKAIDPWGTIYKMEQYLNVWGLPDVRSLVIVASVALSSVEFLLGTLLLAGSYRRSAPLLLLAVMAFMLPLSGYIALYNPVADCGCFGDFLIISNTATFVKNVFITAALVYLFIYNRRVGGLYNPYLQWIEVVLLASYVLLVAVHGYSIQPLVDFRPYKVGTPLIISQDDEDDAEYAFVYEKDGEQRQFDIDNLPDSTWTFVDRVAIGGEVNDSRTLTLYDADEDVTDLAITGNGDELIMFIPEIKNVDIANTYLINEIERKIDAGGGRFIAVIAADDEGVEVWKDIALADYPVYTAEDTAIKEVARGNISLVYLRDGVIVWKRTLGSMMRNPVIMSDAAMWLPMHEFNGHHRLLVYSCVLIGLLLLLWGVNRGGHAVKWLLYRKNKNKSVTLQD